MDTVLSVLGWSTFGVAVICGLLLNVIGLFGNWLILIAVVAAWALTGTFGPWITLGVLVLAIFGEALEMVMAGYGARRFGGSKGSMVAAFVGCLAGAVLLSPALPIIGTVVGAVAGAFIAAAIYEHLRHQKEVHESLWTGVGAGVGKLGGIAAKFCCGLAILAVMAIAIFA